MYLGKAKDDVRKGAPKLQEKGMVVVIGVGKRINKKELATISGNPDNVYSALESFGFVTRKLQNQHLIRLFF